jgi:hypothetical protein
VTFQCDRATALDLIRAVGFQTRVPIGVVLGRDADALTSATRLYDLKDADVESALTQAIEGTGYTIHREGSVIVLIAVDLALRQRDLLERSGSSNFGAGWPSDKMVCWGIALTGRLRNAAHPGAGYAASCSTSPNDEQFVLNVAPSATIEEIANKIVSQGSKGMWIFRVSAAPQTDEPTEEIDVLPYQHYSNRPIARR